MQEALLEALYDSLKMIPLLFAVYFLIELWEFKFNRKMRDKILSPGKTGPLLGALIGSIPQCGFSVITTALYARRIVSMGTLVAVYLATSDEAIPIIMSQPSRIRVIIPLVLTKICLAIMAGFLVDSFFRSRTGPVPGGAVGSPSDAGKDGAAPAVEPKKGSCEDVGCCGHAVAPGAKQEKPWKLILLHPVGHTAKIFLFILVTSMLINFAFYKLGEERLARLFMKDSVFQPVLAGIVGLIPNCSASVAITQLYLKGAISFGSTISGLSTGAGLGLLVLFKENKDIRNSFLIMGLLLLVGISAGIAIQYVTALFGL